MNVWVLVERYQITLFDPIRFIAEYYLALILLVGCLAGLLASRFLWQLPWAAALLTALMLYTVQPHLVEAWRELVDHTRVKPTWRLAGVQTHPAPAGYWEALRADQTRGRVLFVANYLFLDEADGTVTPTTLHSLTPYLTGREIVGGTFSHWSPVARLLWVGDPWAARLPERVEQHGSRAIFGKPWGEHDPQALVEDLRRLNVTTIVASRQDEAARHVLDALPTVTLFWDNGHFFIYHLHTDGGAWLESSGARAEVIERTPRRWLIQVQESAPQARLLLKMSHYPLWQAHINGQVLPIEANDQALQELDLPAGGPYLLEVVYREGSIEWTGLLLSLLTLAGMAGLLLSPRPRLDPLAARTTPPAETPP